VSDQSGMNAARPGTLRASLRRSAAYVLVLALAGAALGGAAGFRRAATHSAEATILVTPLDGNPFSPTGAGDDLVNLETEAQLVASDTIARQVADQTSPGVSVADVLLGLTVTVPTNTQILQIDYQASSDRIAIQRAEAFAELYLQSRHDRTEALIKSQTDRIQGQLSAQTAALSKLLVRLNGAATGARKALLREQVNGVVVQIGQLRAQLAVLQTGSSDPGQVVTPAQRQGSSLVTNLLTFTVLGLIVGLLLGLLLVVARARRENRIHHVDDVVDAGLQLIGALSQADVDKTNHAVATQGRLPVTLDRDFRNLRVALLSHERRRPVRILYATSSAEMGAPRSALGLAYATARSDLDTILVDATGGSADITGILGLTDSSGFSDVLEADAGLGDALVQVDKHLRVLPAGTKGGTRSDDLLTGPKASSLIESLTTQADIVLVATGAIMEAPSQALAMLTDSIVIEVAEGVTRLADVVAVVNNETISASVLGVVYVDSKRARRSPSN
jgi:polysaccharide biosynthesis transport protein